MSQRDASSEETTDILSRRLRIIQHRKGHKSASDDTFLAWAGMRACPGALRILDLGSGKGTVALLLLSRMPLARVVGIEAHPEHHALALRNAGLNGLSHRYDARLGDLRDPELLAGEAAFDLICGAPPYIPLGSGILPKDAGRAAARFELRGGVEDYVRTAARHLAEGGRAVFLMNGHGRTRAEAAVTREGLVVRRLVGIRPRPCTPQTYWIIDAASGEPGPVIAEELCMRLSDGPDWSPAYASVRRTLDLPSSFDPGFNRRD